MDITNKKIPHNFRNKYLKNSTSGGFISSSNVQTETGLPFTYDEEGNYIIDRTITFKGNVISTGEVCSYAENSPKYEGTYSPLKHAHSIAEVDNLQNIIDSLSNGTGQKITIIDELNSSDKNSALSANQGRILKELINSKGSVNSWDELLNKPSTFPPSEHAHNDKYYSKGETDNQLSTKSNNGHGHDVNEISNAMPHSNFHWSGQDGQPVWLWGGNSSDNYYVYNPHNFSVFNSDNLNGYNRNNLYTGIGNFIQTIGNLHSIVIDGDKDIFYPVVIRTVDSSNWIKNEITISKTLGSQTPNWEGNHPNGTSSGIYRYEYRYGGWDGNGGYIKTLHIHYEYAPFVAHTSILTNAGDGLVIWLRGGGCQYNITANNAFLHYIYYEKTNVGYDPYNQYIEPYTKIENEGIINTKQVPIEVRNSDMIDNLHASQFMRSDISTSCNGNILATGEITAYSDIRLKSDIKELTNRGYLNPVSYIKDGKPSIGFIAQEVQKIYPELVIEESTEDKYLSLNYAQLTAVLSTQINELSAEVKHLKRQINELKKYNNGTTIH